ncbi:MAG: M1 family metallopeptidase [Bacteroidetes bacterium]|nr:M1 family metallopeptidase [Bacteroidota bacterium]
MYWQQQVNYTIDVSLNDAARTLDGFEKLTYINNSPDSLFFIWFHLWPNAYKNDRTAFSDQMLENGSTRFYFSPNEERGYINRLDFRVNGTNAKTEDHPQHQDIIKVVLPAPLPPHSSCVIETPFHVKLPYNFSRGGYQEQSFQATQWYPKPAVYDSRGWHPIPYLDQGEFYSEFGNYNVQITVPQNYVVAATGLLQEKDEKEWMKKRKLFFEEPGKKKKHAATAPVKKPSPPVNPLPAVVPAKTLHYVQNNVHDFAWFADQNFTVASDTLRLPSGRIISVNVFYFAKNETVWNNAVAFTKKAILSKSKLLGEYPYDIVSVVEDDRGLGGMEYPTITYLSSGSTEQTLDEVINHEVGHNWLYGILASNERLHPWMDEGMNTYYDNRYMQQQYGQPGFELPIQPAFIRKKMPADFESSILRSLTNSKKDQPIETPSEQFNQANYNAVAYVKTGQWMQLLEQQLGKPVFDSAMKTYYQRWRFKHPYPEDFKQVLEEVSGKNLDSAFHLLNKKGSLIPKSKKDIQLTFLFNAREPERHHYIALSPAVGYNYYDKVMVGALIHNYTYPAERLQFIFAPLYSAQNKRLNSIGRISYHWYPGNKGAKAELSLSEATFTGSTYQDSTGKINYLHYFKIVPGFRYTFANKNPRSTVNKYIQWKTFIFNEQQLEFTRDNVLQIDRITYPIKTRYINQLLFVLENNRVLYPFKAVLMAHQGDQFIRTSFTGNYFFNYPKGGGVNLRFFAGKFFYTVQKTFIRQFATDEYQLNMTGPKGYEDYTYSNYFFGRSEFDRFWSQQIMIRDGAFKVRTDLLSDKIGKTDDWLTAINLTSDIPKDINPLQVLPVKLPLKAFFDMGTYAGAWKSNAATGRFLYDAGLQLSLFKNVVNVYIPLLYSKVYRDYFKSTIPDKLFIKKLSFSIDFDNITTRKLLPQIPF